MPMIIYTVTIACISNMTEKFNQSRKTALKRAETIVSRPFLFGIKTRHSNSGMEGYFDIVFTELQALK